MISRLSFALILLTAASFATAGTKMLRYPDIHGDQLVFSYAGDLWLANIDGQEPARRLTSHPGLEIYPKFSPDGTRIAFAGQYRGDEQVYVIDTAGGEPKQLTFYPVAGPLPARWGTDHQVYGWGPEGKTVLFRSLRDVFGNGRLYAVSVNGGLPTALPMPRAGSGDYSPDGKQIVYSPLFRDFRTWKRYQGGWAQNLYVFDLENNQAEQITDHARTERDPMWLSEAGIHFVSDRDGTLELFSYDDGAKTQLTEHDTWDIKWASSDGTSRIVYEIAGTIGLFDTRTNSETLLDISVPDDQVRRSKRRIEVAGNIEDFAASPDGKRVVMTARGDVFSVPVEHGVTRNLTQRGDAHDREAAWSPDGKYVAFISDRNGEEQLFVVDQDGGAARALSEPRALRLYQPRWSPDSNHIAYHDHTGTIHVTDLKGKHRTVYHSPYHVSNDYVWSPDSQWLAFSRHQQDTDNDVLSVWSMKDGQVRNVSDGFFNTYSPSFSPDGKHLYFISSREFAPQIGSFEWNYVGDRENGLFALALNAESGNPFLPQNDEVTIDPGEDGGDKKKDAGEEDEEQAVTVKIDFEGLADRVIRVPIDADNINGVQAVEGRILYTTSGPFYYGRQSDVQTTLRGYDIEKRSSDALIENVQGLAISADGKFAIARINGGFKRYEIANPKEPKDISTGNLIVYRAPAEEWPVIFDEVWRRFRDYFYVPNMHGLDWPALREQYRPLLSDVSTREDLNTLIGEMIAELNVGHAYVAGGDLQAPKRSSAALLGARFQWQKGGYRIVHIFEGHNQEPKYRSPLTEVGVDVSEGDFLLAIDGRPLTADDNPYDLLTDRGNQPVELTVNSRASMQGARTVLVDGISDETKLVYLEWVENNRRYVEEKTDGKVGYLHIPNMGADGIYEFIKWYYPQIRKQGLIVDVRSNGGGNVSQMIIRRLMQKPLAFGFQAHSDWSNTYPATAFNGPMVSLINEDSASDGDIFPYFFREAGLGPLIGKKTWGGTVGITGHGPLIDGGQVFVPEFGLGQPGKGWIIEGEGVTPDIEVSNDPASKVDAQLDRGIAEVMKRIEEQSPEFYKKPPSPVKVD